MPDTTLSTLHRRWPTSTRTGNDIVFRARRIGTPEIENLMPAGYLAEDRAIDIGDDADARGQQHLPDRQAEDRALATTLGLTTLGCSSAASTRSSSFLTDLLVAADQGARQEVARRRSRSAPSAQILADYMVGIYATAVSDATAQAKSQLFSLGYSQAGGHGDDHDRERRRDRGRRPGQHHVRRQRDRRRCRPRPTREEQGEVPGRRGAAASRSRSP